MAPIAYIVFNRPRHTRETFAAIRAYQPSQLFIIADGPRLSHPTDGDRCHEVRQIVAKVDWPCQVHRNYASENLGMKRRTLSGLAWVFSQVDRAMILEDDCLASPDFFYFCEALLDFYKDNERVWIVSGSSYQPQQQWGDGSYYFSRRPDSWGWATWRRAWQYYQENIPFLDEWLKSEAWQNCFPNKNSRRYHKRLFRLTQAGTFDTWDYQWVASVMYHGGLSATPNANLVKNIGFGPEATNTRVAIEGPTYEVTQLGPLRHPSEIKVVEKADEYLDQVFGLDRSRIERVVTRGKRIIAKLLRLVPLPT